MYLNIKFFTKQVVFVLRIFIFILKQLKFEANKKCLTIPVSVRPVMKRWREIGLHDRPSKLSAGRYSALVRDQTNIIL